MSMVLRPCGVCGAETLDFDNPHTPEECEAYQEANRKAADEWRRQNEEWKRKLAAGEVKPHGIKFPPSRRVVPTMIRGDEDDD